MLKFYSILIINLTIIFINYCTCQRYDERLPISDLKLHNQNKNHKDIITFPENFNHNPIYHSHNHQYHQHEQQPQGTRQQEQYQPHPHHRIDHTEEYHSNINRNQEKFTSNYDNDTDEVVKVGDLKFIPLDFMMRLNEIDDVNDLLVNFVDDYRDVDVTNRFGEQERSSAIIPKPAGCIPELKTIKLTPESDPSVLYIPTCTRIERCGGCCSHSLLSCQPTEVETVNLEVHKTIYTGANKLKYMGKEIKVVEKHKKCKCDCKIQPQDCHKTQVYRKSDCSCVCANTDEREKCYANHELKLWNPDACACQCKEIKSCSTGYSFDVNHCKCVTRPMSRRYIDSQQEYNSYPPVIPLSDEDYE